MKTMLSGLTPAAHGLAIHDIRDCPPQTTPPIGGDLNAFNSAHNARSIDKHH